MFHVYILLSQKDNRTYVGQTEDLEARFVLHNSGRVMSTKGRHPFTLIHTETFATRAESMARENYWKSGGGRGKMKQLFFKS